AASRRGRRQSYSRASVRVLCNASKRRRADRKIGIVLQLPGNLVLLRIGWRRVCQQSDDRTTERATQEFECARADDGKKVGGSYQRGRGNGLLESLCSERFT